MGSLPHRRTKLVCTLGPASVDRVADLVTAGMDVARINLSHGTDADHARAIRAVAETSLTTAILADLPGPKIRLGDLRAESLDLVSGSEFVLHPGVADAGDASGAPVDDALRDAALERGDRILLADGAVELRVVSNGDEVVTEVVRGGTVRPRAGVNVPSDRLRGSGLTEEDRRAAPRAAKLGAHYLAQSFVRSAADIDELRAVVGPDGPAIVAKIETRPAVDDFDAICAAADAVMIARGDLGVEVPFEEVPIIQKRLVRRALDLGVPTIVATQMLESMIEAPRPTRAEASDVANAIFDGADAIMLSAETAIGANPILAAETAARIAALCDERGDGFRAAGRHPSPSGTDAEALAYAAVALAGASPETAAIACYTRTGRTARMLASLRPRVPILAYSTDAAVVARLALVHGVRPAVTELPPEGRRLATLASNIAGLVPGGSAAVLVASTGVPGSGPNLVEVRRIGTNS